MKLATTIKAEAVSVGLFRLTGRRPLVEDVGGKARVYWSDEDLPYVREWFELQLSRGASVPPDVSVDLLPVVGPYAAKSAAPAVLITLAVGVLLGRWL